MALKHVRIKLDDDDRAWLRQRAAKLDKTMGDIVAELIAANSGPRRKIGKEAKRAKPRE